MLSTIDVLIRTCVRYPYLASPEVPEDVFSAELERFTSGEEGSETPLARPLSNGTFEVYKGWYLVEAAKLAGVRKISIKVGEADHSDMLKLAIGKVFNENNHNAMIKAQALSTVKEGLKLSITGLAEMTGLKRSTINRLLSIQKNLIPEAYEALRNDQIGISIAKKLAAMSRQQQQAEFAFLKQYNFSWKAFEERETGSSPSKVQTESIKLGASASSLSHSSEASSFKKKSTSHKSYEMSLSQTIGAPISIDENLDTDGGEVTITCFSLAELEGVIQKLHNPTIQCKLKFNYADNEHLSTILPELN